MTLPFSGELSLSQIQTEFGGSNPIGLNEYYRGTTGYVIDFSANSAVPTSGTIAIGNFYGTAKRNKILVFINSNTANFNAWTNRSPFYYPGYSDITYYIDSGATVYSNISFGYALTVPSEFNPGDTVTIDNSGRIIGNGMPGGNGGGASSPTLPSSQPGDVGYNGGDAIYVGRPVTIVNNGTIAGGGGGGGGGGAVKTGTYGCGGGGGGGGQGSPLGMYGAGGVGGTFAPPGASNPGGAATPTGGGTGGARVTQPNAFSGKGGNGGGLGAAGTAGEASYGPPTTLFRPGGAAGTAGYYIIGNPYVTWPTTGIRLGLSI